jgi:hypothetical protein
MKTEVLHVRCFRTNCILTNLWRNRCENTEACSACVVRLLWGKFVRAFLLVVILLTFVRQLLVNKFLIGNVYELSVHPHLRRFALLNCVIYCLVVTHYSVLSMSMKHTVKPTC